MPNSDISQDKATDIDNLQSDSGADGVEGDFLASGPDIPVPEDAFFRWKEEVSEEKVENASLGQQAPEQFTQNAHNCFWGGPQFGQGQAAPGFQGQGPMPSPFAPGQYGQGQPYPQGGPAQPFPQGAPNQPFPQGPAGQFPPQQGVAQGYFQGAMAPAYQQAGQAQGFAQQAFPTQGPKDFEEPHDEVPSQEGESQASDIEPSASSAPQEAEPQNDALPNDVSAPQTSGAIDTSTLTSPAPPAAPVIPERFEQEEDSSTTDDSSVHSQDLGAVDESEGENAPSASQAPSTEAGEDEAQAQGSGLDDNASVDESQPAHAHASHATPEPEASVAEAANLRSAIDTADSDEALDHVEGAHIDGSKGADVEGQAEHAEGLQDRAGHAADMQRPNEPQMPEAPQEIPDIQPQNDLQASGSLDIPITTSQFKRVSLTDDSIAPQPDQQSQMPQAPNASETAPFPGYQYQPYADSFQQPQNEGWQQYQQYGYQQPEPAQEPPQSEPYPGYQQDQMISQYASASAIEPMRQMQQEEQLAAQQQGFYQQYPYQDQTQYQPDYQNPYAQPYDSQGYYQNGYAQQPYYQQAPAQDQPFDPQQQYVQQGYPQQFDQQGYYQQPYDQQGFNQQPYDQQYYAQGAQPFEQQSFEQQPFEQQAFDQSQYAQQPQQQFGQQAYYQQPLEQNPYEQNPYEQNPYEQPLLEQQQFAQNPYAQQADFQQPDYQHAPQSDFQQASQAIGGSQEAHSSAIGAEAGDAQGFENPYDQAAAQQPLEQNAAQQEALMSLDRESAIPESGESELFQSPDMQAAPIEAEPAQDFDAQIIVKQDYPQADIDPSVAPDPLAPPELSSEYAQIEQMRQLGEDRIAQDYEAAMASGMIATGVGATGTYADYADKPTTRKERKRAREEALKRAAAHGPSRKKKLSGLKKALLIFGGTVIGLIAIAAIGIGMYLGSINSNLQEGVDEEVKGALQAPTNENEPFYALILGSDTREEGGGGRSDTIILARIDPDEKQVSLVSIPRDTQVQLEGHGTQKLNAAYAFDGTSGAIKAVSDLAGVPISHVVEVDFSGFKEIVDALGGVTVNVPKNTQYQGVSIPEGKQTLNGDQALVFVRCRKTYATGDYQRAENQRQLIGAVLKKTLSSSVIEMTNIIGSITNSISTDLSVTDILALANLMRGMDADDMITCVLPSHTGSQGGVSYVFVEEPEWSEMMEIIDDGGDPNESSSKSSSSKSSSKSSSSSSSSSDSNETIIDIYD